MNIGIIIIVAIAAIWALGVFLGVIGGLSKTFSPPPEAMDSSAVKSQEQKIIDDTEAKRKQMMDDIKQKMEDSNQKF